jgi:hypothetical protein
VVGFCLLDRVRVWENAVEGAKRMKVSKVIVMSFKVLFLLCWCSQIDRYFLLEG